MQEGEPFGLRKSTRECLQKKLLDELLRFVVRHFEGYVHLYEEIAKAASLDASESLRGRLWRELQRSMSRV